MSLSTSVSILESRSGCIGPYFIGCMSTLDRQYVEIFGSSPSISICPSENISICLRKGDINFCFPWRTYSFYECLWGFISGAQIYFQRFIYSGGLILWTDGGSDLDLSLNLLPDRLVWDTSSDFSFHQNSGFLIVYDRYRGGIYV